MVRQEAALPPQLPYELVPLRPAAIAQWGSRAVPPASILQPEVVGKFSEAQACVLLGRHGTRAMPALAQCWCAPWQRTYNVQTDNCNMSTTCPQQRLYLHVGVQEPLVALDTLVVHDDRRRLVAVPPPVWRRVIFPLLFPPRGFLVLHGPASPQNAMLRQRCAGWLICRGRRRRQAQNRQDAVLVAATPHRLAVKSCLT